MVKPTREQLNIRKMSVEDVPKVFDIERNSFSHSSWSIDAFYHEIENNEFATYFVIEFSDKIIGYVGLWLVVDQAQITTIAISKAFRGYGLGQLLLKYAMNYARFSCDVMSLEVRIDNDVAQHVYRNLGFQMVEKERIIMEKARTH